MLAACLQVVAVTAEAPPPTAAHRREARTRAALAPCSPRARWQPAPTIRGKVLAVAAGQAASLLTCATGVFSFLLAREGFIAPSLQSVPSFAAISLIGVASWAYLRPGRARRAPLALYLLLAVLDAEATQLAVRAFDYTFFTSAVLLNATSVPFAMLFTVPLGVRYSRLHLAGVSVCLGAVAVLVASDWAQSGALEDRALGARPLLGDFMCLASAALYAASNVVMEMLLAGDREDPVGARAELLTLSGALSAGICLFQGLAEAGSLRQVASLRDLALGSARVQAALAGFAASHVAVWLFVTGFFSLEAGSSALFNLSLLTVDLYATTFAFLALGVPPYPTYYISLLLMALGVAVFSVGAEPGKSAPGANWGFPLVLRRVASLAGARGAAASAAAAEEDVAALVSSVSTADGASFEPLRGEPPSAPKGAAPAPQAASPAAAPI